MSESKQEREGKGEREVRISYGEERSTRRRGVGELSPMVEIEKGDMQRRDREGETSGFN